MGGSFDFASLNIVHGDTLLSMEEDSTMEAFPDMSALGSSLLPVSGVDDLLQQWGDVPPIDGALDGLPVLDIEL
jgi:hypothetical protein